MIVPFMAQHLAEIVPQRHQIGCHQGIEHARNLEGVGAFTCLSNGVAIAAGGIVPAENYGLVFDAGIGHAWMLISEGVTHKWPELFRAAYHVVHSGLGQYHRIEATTTFREGERLLRMLGMVCEGHLEKFNFRGEDVSLWAITR